MPRQQHFESALNPDFLTLFGRSIQKSGGDPVFWIQAVGGECYADPGLVDSLANHRAAEDPHHSGPLLPALPPVRREKRENSEGRLCEDFLLPSLPSGGGEAGREGLGE